jgi:Ser/Thr protein kinase RdoA (MazF antagonist)
VPSAGQRTWGDELSETRGVLARVTARQPASAGAADELLGEVQRIAARVPPDAAGPAHRSFRPAQVLLHGDDIGFIDFDGFCQAEPALDIALFRATVRDLGMGTLPGGASPAACRARADRLEELCEEFLDAYRARAPVSPERVAVWEALDLLTNVLHAWTKAKPVRLAYGVALLRDHADRLGALARAR